MMRHRSASRPTEGSRRRRTRRGVVTAAVSVALALTLAACGSSDDAATTLTPERSHALVNPTLSSTPSAPPGITVERVQYYNGPDADPDQNWADFYFPAGHHDVDTVPLVVLVHGGAWKMPLGAEIFDELARDIANRGMAVYNIEYRRVGAGGGWPSTFLDVARALDYVPEIDKKYPEITTDDEVVVGHSAGAQLAVWGGTRHKLTPGEVGAAPKFRPTRIVSLAGPLDMVQAVKDGDTRIVDALGGEPHQVPARYKAVDPIQNADPTIPVAALHGTADTMVYPHNSIRYVNVLDKSGGKGHLVLFDGETHTSIVKRGTNPYNVAIDLIATYAKVPIQKLPT